MIKIGKNLREILAKINKASQDGTFIKLIEIYSAGIDEKNEIEFVRLVF